MTLIVVGAGGFGREVFGYALDAGVVVGGFADDNPQALDGFAGAARIIVSIADATPREHERYVIAIGDPIVRWRVAAALAARGAKFASVIHPTAYVGRGARIGVGVVLAPFSFVGSSSYLASHVVLNTYASAGHDAKLGRCAVLSPYAAVNGAVQIGDGAFLGTRATMLPEKRLGAWAKLAAGATATADIEAGALAIGNPARGRVMFVPPSSAGPSDDSQGVA